MGKTVLITGANGFVGKNLVHALSAEPEIKVVAADMQDTFIPLYGSCSSNVDYVSGDLSSRETVKILREEFRFDVIIHLAGVLSQSEDIDTCYSVMRSNIYPTLLLLDVARVHGAQFIFPSTALIYGDNKAPFSEEMSARPKIFYAMSKYMSEELIHFNNRKYGTNYIIFRIGVFYGPGQSTASPMFVPSLISHLLDEKDFAMTRGDQIRDFVYIGDFAKLVMRVIDKPFISGVFNVGTGHAPALKDVAKIAAELTGGKGRIRLGAVPYRDDEVWVYCLNTVKTRAEFDWEPSTGLKDGLRQTIEYQRKIKEPLK